MLVIVMHNNEDYLEFLMKLAKKEGINDFAIVKKEGIGTRLMGGDANFIFSKGRMRQEYEKALVAVVKDEEKAKTFFDTIENNKYLKMLNIKNKGFMCVLPFNCITHFKLELNSMKKEDKEV